MGRDTRYTVYCNVQMPMDQGRKLQKLVAELRASGAHQALDPVLAEMESELENSIEFVEEMLRGASGFGRRPH